MEAQFRHLFQKGAIRRYSNDKIRPVDTASVRQLDGEQRLRCILEEEHDIDCLLKFIVASVRPGRLQAG